MVNLVEEPLPTQEAKASISIDPNYFITISGTQTALWAQRVQVGVIDGVYNKGYLLSGEWGKNGLLKTSDGAQALTFGPFDRPIELSLKFQAKHDDSGFTDSKLKPDYTQADRQVHIERYLDVFMFHAEDGGDDDYHDTTLVVTLIATEKPLTIVPWPPQTEGTYRINNMGLEFWELRAKLDDSDPRVVDLKPFDFFCKAQKWLITPFKPGDDSQGQDTGTSQVQGSTGEGTTDANNFTRKVTDGLYKISCVQDGALLVAEYGLQYNSKERVDGPMGETASNAVGKDDVWYMKGLEFQNIKFTRIYPTHKNKEGEYFLVGKACAGYGLKNVLGGYDRIVHFETAAKDSDLGPNQNWVFVVVDE